MYDKSSVKKVRFPGSIARSPIAKLGIFVSAALALTFLQFASPAHAQEPLPPKAKVAVSIGYWSAAWWRWAASFPLTDNPLVDTTGQFASLGNVGGPVFFGVVSSQPGSVTLTYTLPGGQYLLLPLYTYVWAYDDTCDNEKCARQIANAYVHAVTSLETTIDGRPVHHLFRHYETTPNVFTLNVVDNGIFGPTGGMFNAVSSGYWLMLEPLQPGRHVISTAVMAPYSSASSDGHVPGPAVLAQTTLILDVVCEHGDSGETNRCDRGERDQ